MARRGLDWTIDSAGTGSWHIGDPPDPRMIAAATARGVVLQHLRARQAVGDDFYAFDHIYAMDRQNLADLETLKPSDARADLHLFLGSGDVPDPYYGGDQGFDRVLDLIEARMESILTALAND